MQKSYGVVWREGARPVSAGKLELLPEALRLEGREGSRSVPYEQIFGVHIGRSPSERIEGRPSVVFERRGGDRLTISAVVQAGLIGEIAERLTVLQLGAQKSRRFVVVLPLKPGTREEARALLDAGPPFDPAAIAGLDRHEVYLTENEVVFLFASDRGADALAPLLARPEVWQAASAWRNYFAGPPRIAEGLYSWSRANGNGDLSYPPTPGPGDSEGGDIF